MKHRHRPFSPRTPLPLQSDPREVVGAGVVSSHAVVENDAVVVAHSTVVSFKIAVVPMLVVVADAVVVVCRPVLEVGVNGHRPGHQCPAGHETPGIACVDPSGQ